MLNFLVAILVLTPIDERPTPKLGEPAMCVSLWRQADWACYNDQHYCADNMALFYTFCAVKQSEKSKDKE